MSNNSLPLAHTSTAIRAGLAFARDTREIATAWLHYHQDVVRHTSEASEALLRARTFDEVQEAQAKLLHGTVQSFRDRTTKIAETVGRMATRLCDAPEDAGVKDGAGASA